MILIPDNMWREMLAVTKVFAEGHRPQSLRFRNAVRRAAVLYRKAAKYESGMKGVVWSDVAGNGEDKCTDKE